MRFDCPRRSRSKDRLLRNRPRIVLPHYCSRHPVRHDGPAVGGNSTMRIRICESRDISASRRGSFSACRPITILWSGADRSARSSTRSSLARHDALAARCGEGTLNREPKNGASRSAGEETSVPPDLAVIARRGDGDDIAAVHGCGHSSATSMKPKATRSPGRPRRSAACVNWVETCIQNSGELAATIIGSFTSLAPLQKSHVPGASFGAPLTYFSPLSYMSWPEPEHFGHVRFL
jgi:hypothetical protein